jgi:hypothetical protein
MTGAHNVEENTYDDNTTISLNRALYDMTVEYRQGRVDQMYNKSKYGYSILMDIVTCWKQYFGHLSRFS